MWEDPIVEEVRKVRETHAAQFHYHLQAIYRDLKEQEKKSGRVFVSYPPKCVELDAQTGIVQEVSFWPNKGILRTGSAG